VFIFDKDDTLVGLHEFKITNEGTAKLLTVLKRGGKEVYIVSNSVRTKGLTVSYLSPDNSTQQFL
jgi:predicted HAD superfamily phosphohydrolase YqeG